MRTFISPVPGLWWLSVLVLSIGLSTSSVQAQRFAAIGDYGFAGQPAQNVATMVLGWNPEFIITLGDNNYDYGEASTIDQNIGQYYHSYIYPYTGRYGAASPNAENRFFPSIGNHDMASANGQGYRDFFTLPGNERYYDYVRGNVHFFVVNSDPSEPDGISSTSVQARWLQQAMAASTKPWKVVYFHHAPYSSGAYGNIAVMQWPFKEWGASLVMAGHNHHYERLLINGLTYIVNGLGGRSLYGVGQSSAGTQALYGADYGAMLLQASATSLAMQFYTRTNQLIDSYTLLRSGPLPVALTSLQATRRGAGAVLTWTTAQEQNSRGFTVETSPDGLNYRLLGFVASPSPTSTVARQYTFTDGAAGKVGLYFYRLRQEDTDGQQAYFGPVPVLFEPLPVALSTHPNPFAQELTVDITAAAAAPATLTLTDFQGRVVWRVVQAVQAGPNHLTVVPPLAPGLYQATVLVNGRLLRQRLAKQ